MATFSGVLAMIAVAQLNSAMATILWPGEAQYGDASQEARLLRGEAVYQPLHRLPFEIVSYTPLY